MTRLWNGLLLGLVCWRAGELVAQDSVPSTALTYAGLLRANYQPLETVRQGRSAMPSKLSRTVTLVRHDVLLQQVLLDIANQAGLGLSYGEDLARSGTMISIDVARVRAADALAAAVHGTAWAVFVNPASQVTVVKATTPKLGSVVGRITDATTGEGLPGVELLLQEARLRTSTDTTGRYHFAGIDSGTYTLVIRMLGYKKRSERVTVHGDGVDTVNAALDRMAVPLNELVTTATGQQRRRDIGNDITTIRADSVLRNAPIRNLTDLLETRVPGLTVQHTTGAPGDPAKLRLRGLRSALRSNDPVVIVDGIRVYAAQSDARSGNLTNVYGASLSGRDVETASGTVASSGVPAPSPLDQIDPNIIDKIEVFKGPSAATLYGADAANGVIVITTKRGKPGPVVWNASVVHGRTTIPGHFAVGYYRWGHDLLKGFPKFCTLVDLFCTPDSLKQFQALNDPSLTLLGSGKTTNLTLTASGGTAALTYRITGAYGNDIGFLTLPEFEVIRFQDSFNQAPPSWMRRPHQYKDWSVASAVTAQLSRSADLTLTTALSGSDQRRSSLENQIAPFMAVYIDTASGRYYVPNTHYTVDETSQILRNYYVRTTASNLTFTTGLNAQWRPRRWLDVSSQAGLNVMPRNDQLFLPPGLVSATDSGTAIRGNGRSVVGTFNVQGAVRKSIGHGFQFITNVGANLTTTNTQDLTSSASGLLPGTTSIAGAKRTSTTENGSNASIYGWYVEPRVTGQRLALSTGLRLDGGSAYGTRITGGVGGPGRGFLRNLLALPKLNGSWVISEEPWFPFRALFSSLQLRGAYGQAQVQPGPADRLRIYSRTADQGGALTVTGVGNTQLRPERSTEFEGGFNADMLDSRVSLGFTAYRNTQIDALMSLAIPQSVNGGGTVFKNIGNIRNAGVNLELSGTPIRTSALIWQTDLQFNRQSNKLLKLGRGVDPNPNRGLVVGYPLGSRWALPILGFADENGDGILQRSEIQVGDSLVYMGRLYPDYDMVFNTSTALFNAITIAATFTYSAGMTQVDQTAYANWVLARGLVDPMAPFSEQAAVLAFKGDGGLSPATDYGTMQTVSTFRFHSLSVRYQVPRGAARLLGAQQLSVAVQGSNLGLHSTYRGKDPDVNMWSPGENIADAGQLPQPRVWQLRVDVQY